MHAVKYECSEVTVNDGLQCWHISGNPRLYKDSSSYAYILQY